VGWVQEERRRDADRMRFNKRCFIIFIYLVIDIYFKPSINLQSPDMLMLFSLSPSIPLPREGGGRTLYYPVKISSFRKA
jgi:hypothetical protein